LHLVEQRVLPYFLFFKKLADNSTLILNYQHSFKCQHFNIHIKSTGYIHNFRLNLLAWSLHVNNYGEHYLNELEMPNNLNEVNKMILNKVVAKKDVCQNRSRALSLLMEEMAVWYPAPYYDIEAMVSKETKGFKSNRRSKINSSALPAKRSNNKKSSEALNSASVCAM
jgi:hypothetical protein